MVSHHVEEGSARPARVVEVGEAIALPGTEMQQDCGRAIGDAPVAISRSCRHALEEGKDATHGWDVVEGGDEVHLGGSRVGEADINAASDERGEQGLCTVH